MIDLEGYTLTQEEKNLLAHPLVGGVILFSRNYASPQQLSALTADIHAIRQPPLLIAVDHEGGRVQRFREAFTPIPAAMKLGQYYDINAKKALSLTEEIGWLLASELRAVGIDFSFTPVLDLGCGISTVIDDRAFHAQPDVIGQLAQALMLGMKKAGMIAVGKHFPGHGSVIADSHHDIPIDPRCYADIQLADLIPFERMIHYGLPAIMPAHVIYSQVDNQPAGFSSYWLQTVLRQTLNFQGVIFSDDITMTGATVVGDTLTRTQKALQAGCDMVLICNDRTTAIQVIDNLGDYYSPASQARLIRLHGRNHIDWETLHQDQHYLAIQTMCHQFNQTPELNLHDDELY